MLEVCYVLICVAYCLQSWLLVRLMNRVERLEDIAHDASVKLGELDYV